jgi:hypothetical protein
MRWLEVIEYAEIGCNALCYLIVTVDSGFLTRPTKHRRDKAGSSITDISQHD